MHKKIILQICRRFGPIGGMERYVWELCRELAAMGHQIHVLCEINLCTEPLTNIIIHELGQVHPKPRWLAHIRFSNHVHQWLEKHRMPEMLIHSHERTADHHITTFHGPPFAKVHDLPIWKRLSLRSYMNLWLEKRELSIDSVQMIVPNSTQISQTLAHYYPNIQSKLTQAITPGVSNLDKRPKRAISSNGGVIGFIGKEWKRKGLKKAISIVSQLAKLRPDVQLLVAGPQSNSIQPFFKDVNFSYSLLGETDVNTFYPQLDVLLHPALNEPYGMVISEALTTNVPVVISDVCGACDDVSTSNGSLLSLQSSDTEWASQLDFWLVRDIHYHSHYQRNWHDVAMGYEQLYRAIKTA